MPLPNEEARGDDRAVSLPKPIASTERDLTTPDDATEDVDAPGDATPSAELEAIAAASRDLAPETPTLPIGGLGLARVLELDDHGGDVQVEVGGAFTTAALDASVHRAVVETARRTGSLVMVTRRADGRLAIVGALRTQPTPGVDEMDEIRLEARRVELHATEEVQLRSGIATIALRAVGEVETYADRIVSRAEELQKIVARMLRLN